MADFEIPHWRDVPITLGSDGLYHGKISVGHKPNGTLDRRHRSGGDVKAVQDKLKKLLKEIDGGGARRPGRTPTVEEWFSTWLTDIAPHGRVGLAPRTVDDYWSKCRNWIFPHLGALRVDTIEPEDLDRLYAAMRAARKAESHVLKVHAILSRGLGVAMIRGKTTRNVTQLVGKPGGSKPKRTPLDRSTVVKIVQVVEGRRNAPRWMVGLSIGSRQGEALGLTWPMVDLVDGTVQIDWQLQRLTWAHGCADPHDCGNAHPPAPGEKQGRPARHRFTKCPPATRGPDKGRCAIHHGAAGCPKPCTRTCVRHAASCPQRRDGGLVLTRPKTWTEDGDPHVVALPDQVLEMLRAHRVRQNEERLAAGNMWRRMPHPEGGIADLVFRQPDGAPIDPRQDWSEWQRILVDAGVERGRVHAMRHTAATMLLELGVELAVVQEVLGHADIRTTRGYTKVRTAATRSAAKRMGGAMFGRPAKPAADTVTDLVTGRQARRSSNR
jgi:integrase